MMYHITMEVYTIQKSEQEETYVNMLAFAP